jgi:hypothetical protein
MTWCSEKSAGTTLPLPYSCHRLKTGSGAHPASYPVSTGDTLKRPELEADHSPPSSAEVKYALSYTSTPMYVFMAWCLVKHRKTLPFAAPQNSIPTSGKCKRCTSLKKGTVLGGDNVSHASSDSVIREIPWHRYMDSSWGISLFDILFTSPRRPIAKEKCSTGRKWWAQWLVLRRNTTLSILTSTTNTDKEAVYVEHVSFT